jgi:hypothetical protein
VSSQFFDLSIGRLLRPPRWRILKILLPPIRSHIQQPVSIRQRFRPARVGRVRMKESILQPEENTQPMRLPFHLHGVTHGRFCLFLRPVVLFRGRNIRIQRYVKIVIKIRPKRRQPIYVPPFFGFVFFKFRERRPRNHRERRVLLVQ